MADFIIKSSLSWKEFKNYLKYKSKETGVEYLIFRLKVENDNKLFRRKAKSSSIAPKVNLMEQVVKFHNKNQKTKLVEKGKIIAKFNVKCFTCNKTRHLAKCCKNKAWNEHLANKVLEINMYVIVS